MLRGSSRSCKPQLPTDLNRGFSTYGPHRDELAIVRDGRELRSFGSQGEQRLALLALLLAERFVLARERTHVPLMLLDDVMSELDLTRRELLSAELQSAGQSVIATTDLAHVPGSGDGTGHAFAYLTWGHLGRGARRVSRLAPRPLSFALEGLTAALAPATTLARVQQVWEQALGTRIAEAGTPISEHDGVLTVDVPTRFGPRSSSLWARSW